MEIIAISKAQFNGFFKICLDKLSLETLRQKEYMLDFKSNELVNLHRKFHYEISKLRDQLEKG